jgi:hypothetical protein
MGRYEYFHLNNDMFREAAAGFCQTILDISEAEQTKVKQVMEEIEQNIVERLNGMDKRDDGNSKLPNNQE